jgi:syntaxin-binding protein 5
LHVGTSQGNVATLRVLPESSGRYGVKFDGITNVDGWVINIIPLTQAGTSAHATQQRVAYLKQNGKIHGFVVAISSYGVKQFRPSSGKGVSKSFDFACSAANVVWLARSTVLQALGSDGKIRVYSLPALKEITSSPLPMTLDPQRIQEAVVTQLGDILAWTSPAEVCLLKLWTRSYDL